MLPDIPDVLPDIPDVLPGIPDVLPGIPDMLSDIPDVLSDVPDALSNVPDNLLSILGVQKRHYINRYLVSPSSATTKALILTFESAFFIIPLMIYISNQYVTDAYV